jgi:hypothetical protein
VIDRTPPTLSTEQVAQVLRLLRGPDRVELRLSVPDVDHQSAVGALGMDQLDGRIRQVVFFDTPDLDLFQLGVVVRARRTEGDGSQPAETGVQLRSLIPDEVPVPLRASDGFTLEVDAMPGGYVCSGALNANVDAAALEGVLAGDRPVRELFTEQQRILFAEHAPDGLGLDDLTPLGPIDVLGLELTPLDVPRPLVANLWSYPDASRILELSISCETTEAFDVATDTRRFLAGKGITVVAGQQTPAGRALELCASGLAVSPGRTRPCC